MKKDNKMPFLEALRLSNRAYSMFYKQCPQLVVSRLIYIIWTSLTPYVAVFLSALIIDELAGARNLDRLIFLVSITLVLEAVIALVSALLKKWKETYEKSISYTMSEMFSEKMLSTDFENIDNTKTSEQLSSIIKNSQYAGFGLLNAFYSYDKLVYSLLTTLGGIALTVTLFITPVPLSAGSLTVLNNPFVVIAIIAILLLITFISPLARSKAESYYSKIADFATEENSLYSFYANISEEEPLSLDMRLYEQYKIGNKYFTDKEYTFGSKGLFAHLLRGPIGLYSALSTAISLLFTGFVYAFVCLKAIAGAFGLGSVTQYVVAITKVSSGLSEFVATLGLISNNGLFLKETFDFFDIQDKMYQGSLTVEKRSDRMYQVEFKDVSFKYPGSDNYALRHVNMKFDIGKTLAVVGENGSGKTTFIKLLCRFYDPDEGEILLNGIDIRKYNYREYMDIFSVVFQDFKLMSLKLGENVASSTVYDEERVLDCLKKAGFEDRLKSLPLGLDTYLYNDFDKDGINVSGGEAQKIAIARALYKDSPFMILDEPTAALDPIAESEIYSKFDEISGDKTSIYISHRLSSCKFCDEILVFDSGSIVQQGEHEKLIQDVSGKYFKLWNAQAQYYVNA